jgi:hypothetical protein
MKTSDRQRCQQLRAFGWRAAAILLSVLGVFAARAADTTNFVGAFAPTNWVLQPDLGVVYFTNSGTWLVLAGPDAPANSTNSNDGVTYNGPLGGGLVEAGRIQFHWQFNAYDANPAQVDMSWTGGPGATLVPAGGPNFDSGDFSLDLEQDVHFSFLFGTTTPANKISGVFIISDFRFTPLIVPEPAAGGLFASALFVLGAARCWSGRRRSRRINS